MKILKNPNLEYIPIAESGGYVYIIETDKDIKIGRSKNLKQRINSIKTTSGKNIVNIYITPACSNYCFIENEMHKIFKKQRVIGEWFNSNIKEVVEKLETFNFAEPIPTKDNDTLSELLDKFLEKEFEPMTIIKKNNSRLYEYLKRNNFNVFLDDITDSMYVSGMENGEYFEMSFELFKAVYLSNITKI